VLEEEERTVSLSRSSASRAGVLSVLSVSSYASRMPVFYMRTEPARSEIASNATGDGYPPASPGCKQRSQCGHVFPPSPPQNSTQPPARLSRPVGDCAAAAAAAANATIMREPRRDAAGCEHKHESVESRTHHGRRASHRRQYGSARGSVRINTVLDGGAASGMKAVTHG
jgi:hypothetical protein